MLAILVLLLISMAPPSFSAIDCIGMVANLAEETPSFWSRFTSLFQNRAGRPAIAGSPRDHNEFLRQIAASPEDDTVRLVYADFLEESGQPERARYIREQIELAQWDAQDEKSSEGRRKELRESGEKLLKAHPQWTPAGLEPFTPRWRRGFIEEIRVNINDFSRERGSYKKGDVAGLPSLLVKVPTIHTLSLKLSGYQRDDAAENFVRYMRENAAGLGSIRHLRIPEYMHFDVRYPFQAIRDNPKMEVLELNHRWRRTTKLTRLGENEFHLEAGGDNPFENLTTPVPHVTSLAITLGRDSTDQSDLTLPPFPKLQKLTFNLSRTSDVYRESLQGDNGFLLRSDIRGVTDLTIHGLHFFGWQWQPANGFSKLKTLKITWNSETDQGIERNDETEPHAHIIAAMPPFPHLTELVLPKQFSKSAREVIEAERKARNPRLAVRYE